jgi:hypothetical protein
MKEKIETRVAPEKVWASWERAYEKQKGVAGKFQYQVLDVIPGEQFTILWKTFFVKLLFSHIVSPTKLGSEICYSVKIKGPFAWPVRWFLGNKIRYNIGLVLKAIVKQLEEESIIEARHRR